MIKVVAKNFLKEGTKEEVLEIFKELVAETVKEKGCIKYEVFEDLKNPNILSMIEEWESMEDLTAHMNSEHFKKLVPSLAKFMEKEGEINLYKKYSL